MPRNRSLIATMTWLAAAVVSAAQAQDSGAPTAGGHGSHRGQTMAGHHEHGVPAVALTFTELEHTAQALAEARRATAKYQDVLVAEAAGYRAIGPSVQGMGIHYVRQANHQQFSITEPPILLYERDASVTGGLRLVGVSYLLVAPAGADGQPANPPFPRTLASWHKHNNVCVLPDNSASVDLTETECTGRKGRFTAETSWMLHAWIWKDSPAGVFSPTNPLVKP
jgi:hypothetical protein